MSNLFSIILTALLSTLGSIVYFQYQSKKQKRRDVLKSRLTNLLLPLYYILKDDELQFHAWVISDADPYEYVSDLPKRMFAPLIDIIKVNLYLADTELHDSCLSFIEWAYKSDTNERFQRVHDSELIEDEIFKSFRDIVYKKYNQDRQNYLK